jgi:deferrochelatase/peroxidase EfeB
VLLRVDDAQAGRKFLGRLTPHIASATNWWNAATTWLEIGISYAGLEALGVPQDSLQSFPEAFRVGMAARARQLGDDGVNDPKHWDKPYGVGQIHIGVSAFSDSEEKHQRALAVAREQYEGFSGVSVMAMQDFGAQPGDRNSLGYKDGIDQPAIEGSGAAPLPGQGRPIKAGEFILDIRVRPGSSCRCRSRTYLVATVLMWASANISRVSARSIDFCWPMEAPRPNGNWSPRSSSVVGAAELR